MANRGGTYKRRKPGAKAERVGGTAPRPGPHQAQGANAAAAPIGGTETETGGQSGNKRAAASAEQTSAARGRDEETGT